MRVVVMFLLNALVTPGAAQQITGKVVAQQNVQAGSSRIAVDLRNVSLKEAIDDIAKRGGVMISYNVEPVLTNRKVTIQEPGISVKDALARVLRGTELKVAVSPEGQMVIIKDESTMRKRAGQGIITGHVTDSKGRGLSGANVSVASDARGAVTDSEGIYRLTGIASGNQTVTVRAVGYAKQSRSVMVGEGSTSTIDFKLEPSANVLDQVIVTGTVVQTELKAVPNAITIITAKQIEEHGITHIDQLFRGEIPGLFALSRGSGALLDEVRMFSRGATALTSNSVGTQDDAGQATFTNPIKTYVDGVELADPKYLSQIDPKSIERIEILAGPQASTIYGSNAMNGVMQVFTKRGVATKPQVTINLLSGWLENNFSKSLTPQHDYGAQVAGVEGRFSYNAGGTWNYTGAWTPAKKTARLSSFAGARSDMSTSLGRLTADVSIRRGTTRNWQRGSAQQTRSAYVESGLYGVSNGNGLSQLQDYILVGQTLGITVGYAPKQWWSNEFVIGQDVSKTDVHRVARGYQFVSDTTQFLSLNDAERHSLRYTATFIAPITSSLQTTITSGADAWQTSSFTMYIFPQALTGTLTGDYNVTRRPDHNTGGFLQSQVGIADKLFLTYGLRAEWNPALGREAQPNLASRYGVAYTHELESLLGGTTAKLRASYGKSTRPPAVGYRAARTTMQIGGASASVLQAFGNYDVYVANPDLTPEYQQGGEGGIELYFARMASLVVTRYNQTVDGLIDSHMIDSTRSFFPTTIGHTFDSDGYGYLYQFRYSNLASIRNQGWEISSGINTGPLTTRGTYSWTKSRTLGVTPQYRALVSNLPQYRTGASFQYLPEHTWSLGFTYAHAATTLNLNINGTGQLMNNQDDLRYQNLAASVRLQTNRYNMNNGTNYISFVRGYSTTDIGASRKFGRNIEGVFQVHNLANYFKNDADVTYASMGRQTILGLRLRH